MSEQRVEAEAAHGCLDFLDITDYKIPDISTVYEEDLTPILSWTLSNNATDWDDPTKWENPDFTAERESPNFTSEMEIPNLSEMVLDNLPDEELADIAEWIVDDYLPNEMDLAALADPSSEPQPNIVCSSLVKSTNISVESRSDQSDDSESSGQQEMNSRSHHSEIGSLKLKPCYVKLTALRLELPPKKKTTETRPHCDTRHTVNPSKMGAELGSQKSDHSRQPELKPRKTPTKPPPSSSSAENCRDPAPKGASGNLNRTPLSSLGGNADEGSFIRMQRISKREVWQLMGTFRSDLVAISQGKLYSQFHQLYSKEARGDETYKSNVKYFAVGQEDDVMSVLVSFFTGGKDKKELQYLMKVLMPESLIRIYRHFTGRTLPP